MPSKVPVVDLFAGPGGLSEGFSSVAVGGVRSFNVRLSIEKDAVAHKTLLLRAFTRSLSASGPDALRAYRDLVRRGVPHGRGLERELAAISSEALERAKNEAWCCELGGGEHSAEEVDRRITSVLPQEESPWILIGGPPCQAYSLVGRARMQNAEDYRRLRGQFEDDHRHVLYRQYLRILARHVPPVFVMENVKGILSAKLRGERIFPLILRDLRKPWQAAHGYELGAGFPQHSYRILSFVTGSEPEADADYMIRSERYGVPQARHRVILLGVREDVAQRCRTPVRCLRPCDAERTISDVIMDLPPLRAGVSSRQPRTRSPAGDLPPSTMHFSRDPDSLDTWKGVFRDIEKAEWFADVESRTRRAILETCHRMLSMDLRKGWDGFVPCSMKPGNPLSDWYYAPSLGGITGHMAREHMPEDLHRYLFVAAFGREHGRSPTLPDFPKALLPRHRNVGDAETGVKFADRFKVQRIDQPASTITSHISQDGHYYIHYDPAQCRSLTVREAARVQTFPDDYHFVGNRTQCYHQVGNAVPPLLALQLAEVVHDVIRRVWT